MVDIYLSKDIAQIKDRITQIINLQQNLEKILICSLNIGFIQQIINLNKPFKLKSLFITDGLQIESLQQLLQMSGGYIENFGFDLSLNQRLLELITKYCKNINFLYFDGFENQVTYQMFNLIENNKQNLNYLLINIYGKHNNFYNSPNYNIEGSSIILQNLGQALPSKLEYLSLTLVIKESILECS
ncbi:hypothetical protein C1646_766170 [Rhizophagus diaphanus]|nr:hypothetical protein C1646_766170 [Rhizophagus diaphanus] [Rhizophagus sp. MUCL 43196]